MKDLESDLEDGILPRSGTDSLSAGPSSSICNGNFDGRVVFLTLAWWLRRGGDGT